MPDILKRRDFTFTFKVLTPLHVGAGTDRFIHSGSGEETKETRVACLQRHKDGKPLIPGSSLKGILSRRDRDNDADLFGTVGNYSDDKAGADADSRSGQIGALRPGSAICVDRPAMTDLPFEDKETFILARTSIDNGRGISEANKLFHSEMIKPGVGFSWSVRLETRGDIDALETSLLNRLTEWTSETGIAVGANQTSGLGRIRLNRACTRTDWTAADGRLVAKDPVKASLPGPETTDGHVQTLHLYCRGPFLTCDPGWTEERREKQKSDKNQHPPNLRAMRHDKRPFVLGTMIKGAMRAKAEWLQATGIISGDPAERLFGTTSRRGVVEVQVDAVVRDGEAPTASNRIDRFSGGTIDNALFKIDADYGVLLTISLGFDCRATKQDKAAMKKLIADIRQNGLMLGHGTTKGFGWFEEVKKNDDI